MISQCNPIKSGGTISGALSRAPAVSFLSDELTRGTASGKATVEFVVRSDPDPGDYVAASFTNGAVLLVDPHGPDVFVSAELLEMQ